MGDWTKLGADGIAGSITYLLSGNYVTKIGKYIEINNVGSWNNNSYNNPPVGKPIYSFTISDPLIVEYLDKSYRFDESSNLIIDITIKIRNNSTYLLQNIRYYHNPFQLVRNYSPFEEYEFKYSLNMGKTYDTKINLGIAELANTNSQEECIVTGVNNNTDNNPSSHFIITQRNDLYAPSDWRGLQIDFPTIPTGNSMCVRRIGYTKWLEEQIIEIPKDIFVEMRINDSDEFNLSEVSSDQGEEVNISLKIQNNGINIRDLKAEISIPELLTYISNDCGLILEGETLVIDEMIINNGETFSCNLQFIVVKDFYNVDRFESINFSLYLSDYFNNSEEVRVNIRPLNGYYINIFIPEYAYTNISTSTNIKLISGNNSDFFLSSINFNCGFCKIEDSNFNIGVNGIYELNKDYTVNIYWEDNNENKDTICFKWVSILPEINENKCREINIINSDLLFTDFSNSISSSLELKPENSEIILTNESLSSLLNVIDKEGIGETVNLSYSGDRKLLIIQIFVVITIVGLLFIRRYLIKKH